MRSTVDDLIALASKRHGVMLKQDDPMMILVTINQQLGADMAESQEQIINEFRQEIEQLMLRSSDEAKAISTRLMNASIVAAKEALGNAVQDAIVAGAGKLTVQIAQAREIQNDMSQKMKLLTLTNVALTSVIVLMGIVGLFK